MTVRPIDGGISLRPLRWWDIPAVVTLEEELFPGDSPWSAAMFWSELALRNHYLVCHDPAAELSLVGYAGLALFGDEAQVQTIAVRPSHQGRGIGRRLLSALVTGAGDRMILLEVRTDNDVAIALYLSFGFRRVGVRRHYYQPSGADAYTMARPR